MLYFCITDGMADFLPNSKDYYACDSVADMRQAIDEAITAFTDDNGDTPYLHMIPHHIWEMLSERGASSLNWRLCVARESDRVLDVIGMTETEFKQQNDWRN